MRPPVDDTRIRALARELGNISRVPVRLYLTGGATAVIEGWRASTVDVDLRFEPEVDELMRALPKLKESLAINIELASPPDFIPELPGWRERSPFLLSEGAVSLHHFDLYFPGTVEDRAWLSPGPLRRHGDDRARSRAATTAERAV